MTKPNKPCFIAPSDFGGDFAVFNVREFCDFNVATVSDGKGTVFDVKRPAGDDTAIAAIIDSSSPAPYFPFYGQSNVFEGGSLGVAFGDAAFPHTCVTYAHSPRAGGNVLADESEFVDLRPLTDGPRRAQTLATLSGFAYEFIHRNVKATPSTGFFAFTSWHGGQTIDKFEKGTNNYENVLIGARNADNIMERYGRDVDCKYVTYVQGESATANYEQDLTNLAAELTTDLVAEMNLSSAPKFVILQINNADATLSASGVEVEQFNAAKNNENIILAGPMYNAPFEAVADEIHQGPIGRMILAEVLAVCYVELNENGSFQPFWPVNVTLTNDTIVVRYSETGNGLEIDTDWVSPVPNYGFKVVGATNNAQIDSINIITDRELHIKLDRVPEGNKISLEYAITTDAVNDNWAGGRGQIFSDSGYPSYYNFLGYNVPATVRQYSPRFSLPLVEVIDPDILQKVNSNTNLIAAFTFGEDNAVVANDEFVTIGDRRGQSGFLESLAVTRRAKLESNQINNKSAALFRGWTTDPTSPNTYILRSAALDTACPCAVAVLYKPTDITGGDTVFGVFSNSSARFILNSPSNSGDLNFAYGTSIVSADYVQDEWNLAICDFDGLNIRLYSQNSWSEPVVATGSSGNAPMVFGALNTRGAQAGDMFAKEFMLYQESLFNNPTAFTDLRNYILSAYGV